MEQSQGSGPDRIILTTNVEEKPNGELSLSAGFSSIENFIFQGSVTQRNFRGKGRSCAPIFPIRVSPNRPRSDLPSPIFLIVRLRCPAIFSAVI